MNNLDLLKKLTVNRSFLAKSLESPALRGVKKSVTDKYSDQAHFIYELLQNADDAKATKVKFILENDGLTFIHNGEERFTITDPDNEEADTKFKRLGHINSITSIGNSAKIEAQIGKFGVGFKAVFQYTDTPFIYDDGITFKIERFIVPVYLKDENKISKKNKTIFYFPFNKKEITKSQAFEDIYLKLKTLTIPTLFLNNLQKVGWKVLKDEKLVDQGKFFEDIIEETHIKTTYFKKISYTQILSDQEIKNNILLFSRNIEIVPFHNLPDQKG